MLSQSLHLVNLENALVVVLNTQTQTQKDLGRLLRNIKKTEPPPFAGAALFESELVFRT